MVKDVYTIASNHSVGTSWRRVICFTHRPVYTRGRALDIHQTRRWVKPRATLDALQRKKSLTPAGAKP